MPMTVARILLTAVVAYLTVGLIFGAVISVGGVRRLDTAAAGAGIGVRLLLAPGMVLLWPLLLPRWIRATGERPTESTAHRRAEGQA